MAFVTRLTNLTGAALTFFIPLTDYLLAAGFYFRTNMTGSSEIELSENKSSTLSLSDEMIIFLAWAFVNFLGAGLGFATATGY